ncbi:MAG: metallophosphoesterase [Bacteroidales bacterium]|nr:metallophosphoesterase [Bacteroidales bacterium]
MKADRDFVVFNGDTTNDMMEEGKIARYYMGTASRTFATERPVYVLRGNHEFRGRDATAWPRHFSTETGHPYTAFRYGPFFFIGLDSGEDKPDSDIEYHGLYYTGPYLQEEARWLREVVASPAFRESRVRIVFSHIPPESDGWQGNRNVNEWFVPILNEGGIDLMISGHTHDHRFDAAGSGLSDAQFPVWVNAAVERLDVTVDASGRLSLRAFRPDGTETHTLEIPPSQR